MRHLCNHSADCGCIADLTGRIQLSEPQSLYYELLMDGKADRTSVVLDLDLSGGSGLLFLSLCHWSYPMISSRDFSRSRATSLGFLRFLSPSNVALITLCGFEVPIDFVSTFEIPAACMTARTAPPAMIPVPSTAGFNSTLPEPNSPRT